MKNPLIIPALALCMFPLMVRAESSTATTEPSSTPPAPPFKKRLKDWEKRHEKMLESLPQDIRERFEKVHQKVLQDPKVKELRKKADAAAKEFRDTVRDEIRKVDPELDQMIQDHFEKNQTKVLNKEERQKLMAAREKAKENPAVKAAEAKLKDAKTPEERRNARGELREAMHKAMLEADPSLAPILEKIRPPMSSPSCR